MDCFLFFFFHKLRSWVIVQFNAKLLLETRAKRTTVIWRFRHNLIEIQNVAPLLARNLKKTQLNSTVESLLTCHTLGEEKSGYLIEVGCSGVRYRPNCGVCNVIVAVRCFVKNNYLFATYEKGGNLGWVIFGKTSGFVTGDLSVSYWTIFSRSPVLFRTLFTRKIMLNLLKPRNLCKS